MGTRTVRLDEEAERDLQQIQAASAMPISTALKRGLRAVRDEVVHDSKRSAYDIYCELDLGPGGYAKGPSTKTGAVAKTAIRERSGR